MKLSQFDYNLPKELIAQYPTKRRDGSRMMMLDRGRHTYEHKKFADIVGYLNKGDCLVLNNSKVIPARLFGKRKTGGKVEIFILHRDKNPVEALVKPSSRIKEGETIILESGAEAKILSAVGANNYLPLQARFIEFNHPINEILKTGHIPLPPYISRIDEESDKERYQTVFSKRAGATASPTAGLHFTNEILEKIQEKGVKIVYVTLHVSYGTFAPVLEEDIENHKMHAEYYELPKETAEAIKETKKSKKKVIAVGTTATRVLESGCVPKKGWTNLFIYPGYKFKIVDTLLTNFHLPKSTLMMLVSAFAGREFILKAYEEAIHEQYRFFSYGDCMLIL